MSIKKIGRIGNSSLIGVQLKKIQLEEEKVASCEVELEFCDIAQHQTSCSILVNQFPQSISDKIERVMISNIYEGLEKYRMSRVYDLVGESLDTILQKSLVRKIVPTSNRLLWVYDGWLWELSEEYELKEAASLIWREIDRERHEFDRLNTTLLISQNTL